MDTTLLGNLLTGKGIVRKGYGNRLKSVKQEDGLVRIGFGSKMDC